MPFFWLLTSCIQTSEQMNPIKLRYTYREHSRGKCTPIQGPPLEEDIIHDPISDHGADIVAKLLVTVKPSKGNALRETKDEEGKVSCILIHQDNPVVTSLHGSWKERGDGYKQYR